ncbi:MAG: EAL domain-containing protein, partial [Halomonadaceae bacterium]
RMQAELVARARLETDLYQALPNEEWRLFYQPQVDENGALTGVEALLRWEHPGRGRVSPADFIPLLESTANAAIVESTIALARSLELDVIAEGVETDAQRQWLSARHCHAFQGYLFGRPLPVDELEAQWVKATG